jgi:hypothetical protein
VQLPVINSLSKCPRKGRNVTEAGCGQLILGPPIRQLVELLRYEPKGCWFDFRWGLPPALRFCADSFSNRREHPGSPFEDKDGRCVGLTTLPPLCAYFLKILRLSTSWSHRSLSRPVQVKLYFTLPYLRAYYTIKCTCWFRYEIVFMCCNYSVFCWLLFTILREEWTFAPSVSVDITRFLSHVCCLFLLDFYWTSLRKQFDFFVSTVE